MTAAGCEQITWSTLADYVGGDVSHEQAAAVERHLFTCPACAARAAEYDAIARAIPPAFRAADVAGFVSDALLNRLSREGVRVRTFTLLPGTAVPCAVWEGDELMVLRLRGNLRGAAEVTVTERVAGVEVHRVTGPVIPGSPDEVLYAEPAAEIRKLPVSELDIVVTAHAGADDRLVGTYRLIHGGHLHR